MSHLGEKGLSQQAVIKVLSEKVATLTSKVATMEGMPARLKDQPKSPQKFINPRSPLSGAKLT